MPTSEEPILIAPAAPPLSAHRAPSRTTAKRLPSRRALGIATLAAVLAAAAPYVFLLLPARVEAPTAVLAPAATPDGRRPTSAADAPPPFEALAQQQARERAEEHLAAFIATQLELEQSLNVAAWGANPLEAAQHRAAAGDALFEDGNYGGAQREYEGAAADLKALVAEGEALYEDALAAGQAALDARDQAAADAAFAQALAVRPTSAAAQAGSARAERLPAVVKLLREAERATLRGDHQAAAALLQEAKEADPATAGLDRRLADNRAAQAAVRRQAALSRGFKALAGGDADGALAVFDGILAQRPGDTAAKAGREQAEQARTLAAIERLRRAAREQIESEQWAAALATCEEALAIDPSLQFARAGKAEASQRLALLADIDRIVADPGLLSADDAFRAAEGTAKEAAELEPIGAEFGARLAELRTVLATAARPVPLVLTSDNATEVTIQLVGPVGTFERFEVPLRPGRYVIVGSRDGCRDVRKEVLLTANMLPVDIRCAEAI